MVADQFFSRELTSCLNVWGPHTEIGFFPFVEGILESVYVACRNELGEDVSLYAADCEDDVDDALLDDCEHGTVRGACGLCEDLDRAMLAGFLPGCNEHPEFWAHCKEQGFAHVGAFIDTWESWEAEYLACPNCNSIPSCDWGCELCIPNLALASECGLRIVPRGERAPDLDDAIPF